MSSNLNAGQTAAAKAFFDFLFSDESEFIISGPPGTGKTHLMKHLINVVIPSYQDTSKMLGAKDILDSVHVTATTNKAAAVLGDMTGWSAETIHTFLRLKVISDFTTGKQQIQQTRNWTVHERIILFIDEASMIDRALLHYIQIGTHKAKIVYVGDRHQLNPVGEKVSPVFSLGCKMVELTEPMRTKDPRLQALNAQLQQTVETGVFQPIKVIPGVIDWVDDHGLKQALAHFYSQQTSEHRVLAYRNERVVQFNDYIRQMRGLTDAITVGEQLVSASHVTVNNHKIPVEMEYEVVAVGKKSVYDGIEGVTLDIQHIDIKSSTGVIIQDFRVAADPKHFSELLKWLRKSKKYAPMFTLKETYGELRPRDAATVHKAQGSTYETVIVDLGDISTCHQADQAARMLYVACSRARTRVIFYGDLAEKYGGLIG